MLTSPSSTRPVSLTSSAPPRALGGASGQIYQWLGISKDRSFPDDVRRAIRRTLQAKFFEVGTAWEKKCVRVVGTNFSTDPFSRPVAVQRLASAYCAALSEFATAGAGTLRMLPISGSNFSCFFRHELPALTAEALAKSFGQLGTHLHAFATQGKSLEICFH